MPTIEEIIDQCFDTYLNFSSGEMQHQVRLAKLDLKEKLGSKKQEIIDPTQNNQNQTIKQGE
ncbi:MAG: hypothetical protein WCL30_02275 [Pseudomonadota bacterium]